MLTLRKFSKTKKVIAACLVGVSVIIWAPWTSYIEFPWNSRPIVLTIQSELPFDQEVVVWHRQYQTNKYCFKTPTLLFGLLPLTTSKVAQRTGSATTPVKLEASGSIQVKFNIDDAQSGICGWKSKTSVELTAWENRRLPQTWADVLKTNPLAFTGPAIKRSPMRFDIDGYSHSYVYTVFDDKIALCDKKTSTKFKPDLPDNLRYTLRISKDPADDYFKNPRYSENCE